MANLLSALSCPFFWRTRANWLQRLVSAAIAIAAVIAPLNYYGLFSQADKVTLGPGFEGHALVSFEQALRFRFCGQYGYLGDVERESKFYALNDRAVPYSTQIVLEYGSIDKYCATFVKFQNNENSTFLLNSVFLYIAPNPTPTSLIYCHILFRCALIAIALYGLGLIGVSVLPSAMIAWVAIAMVELIDRTHIISVNPTMAVVLLLSSVLVTNLGIAIRSSKLGVIIPIAIGTGFFEGFVYNLRTSYGIVMLAQILAVLLVGAIGTGNFRRSVRRSYAGSVAGLLASFYLFQAIMIWPLSVPNQNSHSYHSLWHPIVLGLGNPPNPFAQREGIEWNDPVGMDLAKRIDPKTTYLSPSYDIALRQFYFDLWSQHPIEMIQVYWEKINVFGQVMMTQNFGIFEPPFGEIAATIIPNGFAWLGFVIAVSAISFYLIESEQIIALCTIAMTTAVFFVTLEQIMIMPDFYPQYAGGLVVGFAAVLGMLAALIAAHALKWAKERSFLRQSAHQRMVEP